MKKKGIYDRIAIVIIGLGIIFTFANTYYMVQKIEKINNKIK